MSVSSSIRLGSGGGGGTTTTDFLTATGALATGVLAALDAVTGAAVPSVADALEATDDGGGAVVAARVVLMPATLATDVLVAALAAVAGTATGLAALAAAN